MQTTPKWGMTGPTNVVTWMPIAGIDGMRAMAIAGFHGFRAYARVRSNTVI